MIARFNGNVVPFADDATSTNRTVFGGTTQSDLIDDNLNTNFKKGWEIVGLNDNPTREDFNAMGYTLGALISYLYEMGISEWNTLQKYRVNSMVIGSDGNLYKSLTGTSGTPNVGNNPLSDVVNWKSLEAVSLTENQTIAGIKTFSSSPIVPTPTTATQAANKQYVDSTIIDRIGLIDYGYAAKPYHILAFGGVFLRAAYPKLWAYVQTTPGILATEAYWQAEAAAQGGICGFFSAGDGVNTFRVPNLNNAFLRPTIRAVGSFEKDEFKNHSHKTTMYQLSSGPGGGNLLHPGGALVYNSSYIDYEGGTETRPKNIAVLPLIVAK